MVVEPTDLLVLGLGELVLLARDEGGELERALQLLVAEGLLHGVFRVVVPEDVLVLLVRLLLVGQGLRLDRVGLFGEDDH